MIIKTHDYEKYAQNYNKLGIEGSYYIAFRDIPWLLSKFVKGNTAIDYGCGTGRSTLFLKSLGFNVVGVDISDSMLCKARINIPDNDFFKIESAHIPFPDSSVDLVFSSFVFMEVSNIDEIKRILCEMKRVLKRQGSVMFVVACVEDPQLDFLSFSYNFTENYGKINGGDTLKLFIKKENITLYDYNWKYDDYVTALNESGLRLSYCHKPLGQDNDPYHWESESSHDYYHIFIAQKN